MTRKVGIIGCGVIGRGWIILFARSGYEVSVFDRDAAAVDEALNRVRTSLHELEALGWLDAADCFARVGKADTLEQGVKGACYVQESVTEDAGVKSGVFREMDRFAPADVPLGSSCSSIPPSEFLEEIPGRQRCIVAHPFSPPHLVPVVEIVPTSWTSQSVIDRVCRLLKETGQHPVLVNKEVPGYVVNRLQAAVVNEAMYLVGQGVISPVDLDRCMRSGLGLRWAFMGPFETMDLNARGGFMDYATKFGFAYEAMGRELKVSEPWRRETLEMIERWRRSEAPAEELPRRQAWRDEMLVRLRALVDR